MSGGGSSSGNTGRWDPDAPSNFVPEISISVESEGSRRSRKMMKTAHDRDSAYPPNEYTHFAYDVAIRWYKEKTTAFLESTYLRNLTTGKVKLKDTMENVIRTALLQSEKYHNCENDYSSEFATWLQHSVQQCIFNTTHVMQIRHRPPPGSEASEENKLFVEKMKWWATAAGKMSMKTRRAMPWHLGPQLKALACNHNSTLVWVPAEVKVVQLGEYLTGGHGKVRKVRIEGFDNIPSYIEFAGKSPKGGDLRENRIARSSEACVCPLTHPVVVKFWGLHARTMEAYTLWWNGGSLHHMLVLDSKAPPTTDLEAIKRIPTLTEEERSRIFSFRKYRFQLAWALVYVGSLLHKAGVLHNDLSPHNILLHFSEFDDRVFIGICDWGIACLAHENAPSHYGYDKPNITEQQMRARFWVAPELFYTFGPPNSDTNLYTMQRTHVYTRESDSYSIGRLGAAIVGHHEEDTTGLFRDDVGRKYFVQKLADLCKREVKQRSTLNQAMHNLMAPPFNMLPPEAVFRTEA